MKTLALILITAVVSSAGTFFYTTKQMDPYFYREVVDKARGLINTIRSPASNCTSGLGSLPAAGSNEKTDFKILMQKMKKAQQEKKEFLKKFEENDHLPANQ